MLGCERSRDHVSPGTHLAGVLGAGNEEEEGAQGQGGAPWMQFGHVDESHGVVHRLVGQGDAFVSLSCIRELGNEPCWCPTVASKDALNKHSLRKRVRKLLEKHPCGIMIFF